MIQHLYQCVRMKLRNRISTFPLQSGQIEVVDWMIENVISADDLLEQDAKRPLLHQAAKYGQVQ